VRPQRYRPNNKEREKIYQPDVIGIVKKYRNLSAELLANIPTMVAVATTISAVTHIKAFNNTTIQNNSLKILIGVPQDRKEHLIQSKRFYRQYL